MKKHSIWNNADFLSGIVEAYSLCISQLNTFAGDAFRQNDDKEAYALREAAKNLSVQFENYKKDLDKLRLVETIKVK